MLYLFLKLSAQRTEAITLNQIIFYALHQSGRVFLALARFARAAGAAPFAWHFLFVCCTHATRREVVTMEVLAREVVTMEAAVSRRLL